MQNTGAIGRGQGASQHAGEVEGGGKSFPTVSIGMPVYNGARYIGGALDSLLEQSFVDFELIISDNNSTDQTKSLCLAAAKRDSRVRYLRQERNLGPADNFKIVLAQARGKYFMWAAHDDRWSPEFLEKMVELLESDENCNLAFSNYIVRNLENQTEQRYRVTASTSQFAACNYMTRILKMCPSLFYGMYRTEKIKNVKLEVFDFSDVHFVTSLAVKSPVRVANDYLYIAGTKGARDPISVTHHKINRKTFMRKQYQLLRESFSFPTAHFLFLFLCGVMAINKIRLWRY